MRQVLLSSTHSRYDGERMKGTGPKNSSVIMSQRESVTRGDPTVIVIIDLQAAQRRSTGEYRG